MITWPTKNVVWNILGNTENCSFMRLVTFLVADGSRRCLNSQYGRIITIRTVPQAVTKAAIWIQPITGRESVTYSAEFYRLFTTVFSDVTFVFVTPSSRSSLKTVACTVTLWSMDRRSLIDIFRGFLTEVNLWQILLNCALRIRQLRLLSVQILSSVRSCQKWCKYQVI